MVSVNGLPPSRINPTNASSKAKGKGKVQKGKEVAAPAQPTKVATAVSHSINAISEADIQSQVNSSRVHYDLPEGRNRQAMEEYMNVMNQTRKDELARMLGVDIYI